MEAVSSRAIQRLSCLMEGSSMDKDRAETELRGYDPSILPSDILDCWKSGNSFDKFRAGRVKESWSTKEK